MPTKAEKKRIFGAFAAADQTPSSPVAAPREAEEPNNKKRKTKHVPTPAEEEAQIEAKKPKKLAMKKNTPATPACKKDDNDEDEDMEGFESSKAPEQDNSFDAAIGSPSKFKIHLGTAATNDEDSQTGAPPRLTSRDSLKRRIRNKLRKKFVPVRSTKPLTEPKGFELATEKKKVTEEDVQALSPILPSKQHKSTFGYLGASKVNYADESIARSPCIKTLAEKLLEIRNEVPSRFKSRPDPIVFKPLKNTVPQPFKLSTSTKKVEDRGSKLKQVKRRISKSFEADQENKTEQPAVKSARPALQAVNAQAKPTEVKKRNVTQVVPFKLASDIRSEKRKQFDQLMAEKQAEKELLKQKQVEEQAKVELQEIAAARRNELIPKARPLPQFKPVIVSKSTKKLTIPKTPTLETQKRTLTRML